MIPKLVKQYVHIFYLCLFKNSLFTLWIGIWAYVITRHLHIALCMGIVYVLHVTFHEFGHVLFLEIGRIPYQFRAKKFSIEISFCETLFNRLNFGRKIMIIIGGSLVATFFDLMLMILSINPSFTYFAILLISVEALNLILGKDSRVLEQLLKGSV